MQTKKWAHLIFNFNGHIKGCMSLWQYHSTTWHISLQLKHADCQFLPGRTKTLMRSMTIRHKKSPCNPWLPDAEKEIPPTPAWLLCPALSRTPPSQVPSGLSMHGCMHVHPAPTCSRGTLLFSANLESTDHGKINNKGNVNVHRQDVVVPDCVHPSAPRSTVFFSFQGK